MAGIGSTDEGIKRIRQHHVEVRAAFLALKQNTKRNEPLLIYALSSSMKVACTSTMFLLSDSLLEECRWWQYIVQV